MAINGKCLDAIRRLMGNDQNIVVQFFYEKKHITDATIHFDGTTTAHVNGRTYDCPSLMRDDLVGPHLATYPFLFFNGQSLRALGVSPR